MMTYRLRNRQFICENKHFYHRETYDDNEMLECPFCSADAEFFCDVMSCDDFNTLIENDRNPSPFETTDGDKQIVGNDEYGELYKPVMYTIGGDCISNTWGFAKDGDMISSTEWNGEQTESQKRLKISRN